MELSRLFVVHLVGKQCIWIGDMDKRLGSSKILSLAWREHQRDGIAKASTSVVHFSGVSTAQSANRFREFFRAPALC